MEGWLKVPAAAEYMGICTRSLRSLLKQGLKHSRLPSRTVLIAVRNIDEYLENFQIDENESAQRSAEMETEIERLVREITTGK